MQCILIKSFSPPFLAYSSIERYHNHNCFFFPNFGTAHFEIFAGFRRTSLSNRQNKEIFMEVYAKFDGKSLCNVAENIIL